MIFMKFRSRSQTNCIDCHLSKNAGLGVIDKTTKAIVHGIVIIVIHGRSNISKSSLPILFKF